MLFTLLACDCGSVSESPTCVADSGCPDAIRLPACSTLPDDVFDVSTVHEQAAALAGQTISVRGFLTRVGNVCTELGCIDVACCNSCEGRLALADEAYQHLVYPLPTHILIGDDSSEQWLCAGDETGQCCYYIVEEVASLVTGTLEPAPQTTAGLRLITASVCTP